VAVESIRWPPDARGPYKSTNIPVQTLVTPWLDFHMVADRVLVRDLLGEASALGRGYSSGLGTLLGFEYLPDPEDRSLAWRGRPMRSSGMPLVVSS
jgi:hypothetical protein